MLLAAALTALLVLRVPIAFALGIASVVALTRLNIPNQIVTQAMFDGANSFPLLAIPFFLLAGELMNTGGITRRLVDFANSLIGFLRGGLTYVTVVAAMIISGVSGSTVADTSALGSVLIPSMTRAGIPRPFAAATTAAAATVGITIPPSLPMVIFAVTAGESIGALFVGGIIPGLLGGLVLMGICYVTARRHGFAYGEPFSPGLVLVTFGRAFFALVMPILILGGILSGVFTATEAAVVASLYGLLVGMLVYRELRLTDLPRAVLNAARGSAAVMIILSTSQLLALVITLEGVAETLSRAILGFSSERFVILTLVDALLIIAGICLEGPALIIVMVPLLLPVIKALGVDLVQFGLMFTIAVGIGALSPPVAVTLFTSASIAGEKPLRVFWAMRWQFVGIVGLLLLVTHVPVLSTFLPRLFYPR